MLERACHSVARCQSLQGPECEYETIRGPSLLWAGSEKFTVTPPPYLPSPSTQGKPDPMSQHTHTHTNIHTHTYIHAHTDTHPCVHAYTYARIHAYMCTHPCICTHMHTYTLFSVCTVITLPKSAAQTNSLYPSVHWVEINSLLYK